MRRHTIRRRKPRRTDWIVAIRVYTAAGPELGSRQEFFFFFFGRIRETF
jgi:hypothetical protein